MVLTFVQRWEIEKVGANVESKKNKGSESSKNIVSSV